MGCVGMGGINGWMNLRVVVVQGYLAPLDLPLSLQPWLSLSMDRGVQRDGGRRADQGWAAVDWGADPGVRQGRMSPSVEARRDGWFWCGWGLAVGWLVPELESSPILFPSVSRKTPCRQQVCCLHSHLSRRLTPTPLLLLARPPTSGSVCACLSACLPACPTSI